MDPGSGPPVAPQAMMFSALLRPCWLPTTLPARLLRRDGSCDARREPPGEFATYTSDALSSSSAPTSERERTRCFSL